MPRLRFLLLVVASGLSWILVSPGLNERFVRMEVFRVTGVELEGARHLSREDAVASAGIGVGASVWDDPSPWEARLAQHPLVRSARIMRRLPSTLVLVVEESDPVALLPTPTLQPVDEDGRVLPLDPTLHPLDLPLLRVDPSEERGIRILSAESARLGRVEPAFLGEVSELALDEQGNVLAGWGLPQVTFRFRPHVTSRRLREGKRALADAVRREPGGRAGTVDLRWADQVVVRLREGRAQ